MELRTETTRMEAYHEVWTMDWKGSHLYTTLSRLREDRGDPRCQVSRSNLVFIAEVDELIACRRSSKGDLLQELNACSSTIDGCDMDEADASEEQESDSHFPSSSSGSTSISSLVLDTAEPVIMDITRVETVKAFPLPPPYQVTSLRFAKRDLEAIPGCEISFAIEVVLPSYGSVKVKDRSAIRARNLLLHELIKLGAVARNWFVLFLLYRQAFR